MLPREPDDTTAPGHLSGVLLAAMSGPTLRPRTDVPSRSAEANAVSHTNAVLLAERASAARAVADAQVMPAEPPVVRISIGRIDVRVTQAPAAPVRQPAARPAVGMSLERYLERQEGRAR